MSRLNKRCHAYLTTHSLDTKCFVTWEYIAKTESDETVPWDAFFSALTLKASLGRRAKFSNIANNWLKFVIFRVTTIRARHCYSCYTSLKSGDNHCVGCQNLQRKFSVTVHSWPTAPPFIARAMSFRHNAHRFSWVADLCRFIEKT